MAPFGFLNPMQTLVVVGVVVVSALTLLKGRRRRMARGLRLPPGPVPLPLVGNVFSIDAQKPWETYAKWATRYGDIFKIRVLRQDIIVINSKKIAKDLLDRRSRIYSDRPHISTREPFGWTFNFAWSPYGDQWRSQRRMFQQAFRADAALDFRPTQLKKARRLILDIFGSPHDFFKHIERFSIAVSMSIVYDYEVAAGHDHIIELFYRGAPLAMEALTPETAFIIDVFPFLLSLPEWFPGAALKRKAVVSKDCATRMIAEPFEHARKHKAAGGSASAVALDLLANIEDVNDLSQLQLLKDTCATAFVAGTETTTATLQCFMLAMLQHPEIQERACAEIDAVVGTNRLPDFDDRPNLPYIEAILRETLRKYSVAPLSVPHSTTDDDIYEDVFVPKGDDSSEVYAACVDFPFFSILGSVVVPNIWAMHHNEKDYPEPDAFRPERFFVDGSLNGDKAIDSLAFGFGRRICPGRYAVDGSLWVVMVSILYAFKITKALDDQGKELDFEPSFSVGVTTHPHPFPCSITPRLSSVDICGLVTKDI